MMSANAAAQNTQQPFSAVQTLFAAMSAGDTDAMKATFTDDFELLEVGEVWDIDKIIAVVSNSQNTSTRRNFFAVITSKIDADRAWLSYWNRAIYTNDAGQSRTSEWLESAVLVKRGDGWLMEMLHSTRLNAGQHIPDTAQLEEYIPPKQ